MNFDDVFWNIDRITPKSNKTPVSGKKPLFTTINNGEKSIEGVPVSDLLQSIKDNKNKNFSIDKIEVEKKLESFHDSNIILDASVGKWSNIFGYKNDARDDAFQLFLEIGNEAEFVPFSCYNPKFCDLEFSQKRYYLFFRDSVKNYEYPKTTVSYIILFICEIINLPDMYGIEYGLELLINLWKNYANDFDIDKIFADTVFEYCFIHDIKIPFDEIEPVILLKNKYFSSMLTNIYVSDVILSKPEDITIKRLQFLYEQFFCISYKTSKYYESNKNFAAECDRLTYPYLKKVFLTYKDDIKVLMADKRNETPIIKTVKPSYISLYIYSDFKKNLIYEYAPISKDDRDLDPILSYISSFENILRSKFKIKARICRNISASEKVNALAKNELELYGEITKKHEIKEIKPKKVSIDINKAKFIENESWLATKRLCDGIDSEEIEEVKTPSNDSSGFCNVEIKVLENLLCKNIDCAKEVCVSEGYIFEGVIDTVNSKSLDMINDSIIDPGTFEIYEDYLDTVKEMLKEYK